MAANKTTTLVFVAKDQASGVVKKLDASMDGLGKQQGKLGGAFGRIGGAAKTMALVGLGAAIAAVAGLGVALAAGVKGALDEEVGITRLDTALKNNIEGWDGNRQAIEKVIDARTRLAFDDSVLRDSLSSLVARTKDVTAAMDLQGLAMDLARAKGIDLQTASDIIGKVYSGNVGILTRYGIAVDKGATSTEALAAIQKSAGGQAEAYGKTTKGAFDSFNVAINNVFEDVGSNLLPALTTLALFLTNDLIPGVKDIATKVGQWAKDNEPLITQVREFAGGLISTFVEGLEAVVKVFTDFGPLPAIIAAVTLGVYLLNAAVRGNPIIAIASAIIIAIGLLATAWETDFGGMRTAIQKFLKDIEPITTAVSRAFDAIAGSIGFVIGKLDELGRWVRENSDVIGRLSPFGSSYSDLFNQFSAGGGRARAGQGFASGLWNAPRDMAANIHQGEMILPRSAANAVRAGGMGGVTFNIYGATDPEATARAVLQALKRETGRQGVSLNGAP